MTANTEHIIITPKGRHYDARLGDEALPAHRTPFLAAARILLERGHAPGTILTMSRQGEAAFSLRATIGAAARLTVAENETIGPRFGRYRAPPADMPIAGVRGRPKTAGARGSARVAYENTEAAQ